MDVVVVVLVSEYSISIRNPVFYLDLSAFPLCRNVFFTFAAPWDFFP
jgi:hypothetical protein